MHFSERVLYSHEDNMKRCHSIQFYLGLSLMTVSTSFTAAFVPVQLVFWCQCDGWPLHNCSSVIGEGNSSFTNTHIPPTTSHTTTPRPPHHHYTTPTPHYTTSTHHYTPPHPTTTPPHASTHIHTLTHTRMHIHIHIHTYTSTHIRTNIHCGAIEPRIPALISFCCWRVSLSVRCLVCN